MVGVLLLLLLAVLAMEIPTALALTVSFFASDEFNAIVTMPTVPTMDAAFDPSMHAFEILSLLCGVVAYDKVVAAVPSYCIIL